ncbi:MAG: zinc ribbon domain-containing protein [Solobacterium sp.]|nr:zinc ribbon domain-containing protein [Solobacterium sp.]
MFCYNCGAKLPDDSLFCEHCGARLEIPENLSEPETALPITEEIQQEEMYSDGYVRTEYMAEAAVIAADRNPSRAWSYWDSPGQADYNCKKLMRFCEKEDKYLSRTPDREGALYYAVSLDGSIGYVYRSEDDEEARILEWYFFAKGTDPKDLPQSAAELEEFF